MHHKKTNILIVCEHASDVFGGEAALPLHYFMLLSNRFDNVFLLTHERVRSRLEAIPEIRTKNIYYMPDTRLHIFLHRIFAKLPDRIALVTVGALMYFLTQFYQRSMAKKIIREKAIDIVHEPTPVSPKQPSVMFGLGVPVIIGPMNGGMDFPPAFSYLAGNLEKLVYRLVRFSSNVLNILIPGKLFASMLLVANDRTKKALPALKIGQVVEVVENGVLESKIIARSKLNENNGFVHVLYVGRLIDLKMVDIAIHAINICSSPNIKLTIVGDGPAGDALRDLAASLPNSQIEFTGWLPQEMVMDYYDSADVFVLPSVRECGGAVVLEAMARGVPVVAVDWGGPTDYVNEKTGFLITPDSRDSMIHQFARCIELLAGDTDLRRRLGEAAAQRVKNNFTWEKKIEKITTLYCQVLDNRLSKMKKRSHDE